MAIGSLILSPLFESGVTEYTATTTNATNKITATASDSDAFVKIEVNSVEIANGTSATWASGVNTVTITVTNGAAVTTYTVLVTR